MSIKVLYDHQIFTFQNYGGISRYFSNLIKYSKNSNEIEAIIGVVYSTNEFINRSNTVTKFITQFNIGLEKSIRKRLNRQRSNALLKKGKFDIFHPTEFNPYFLKFVEKIPLVITVFDMIPEKFPEHFSQSNIKKYIESKRTLIQKADKIIAISNTAKEDILSFYKIKENRISVIHLAGNTQSSSDNGRKIETPGNYILFVGSRHGYKNFIPFIKAVSSLLLSNDMLHLICCGGGEFNTAEMQLIKDEGINDKVIHYNNISDSILTHLYHNAIAFIFPSIYEGFGIPILEAASAKCPLILSDNSIFHEVAGDAALYFDPLSVDSINNSVSEVVTNSSLQEQLKEKTVHLAKKYSWEKTFNKTKELYKSLI